MSFFVLVILPMVAVTVVLAVAVAAFRRVRRDRAARKLHRAAVRFYARHRDDTRGY